MNYVEYLEGKVDVWISNQIKEGGFNAKRIIKKTSKSNMGNISNAHNMANSNNSKG